jgi:hypothetical protein
MIDQIMVFLGMNDYPFLSQFVSVVVLTVIVLVALNILQSTLFWVGGKR